MGEFDSTLLRRGRKAVTFPEMVEFAATVELRPIAQLLEELPDLARLSEAKFSIASNVLRRRFRNETPVDQLQLRTFGYEIADRVADTRIADRIRSIFEADLA
ncbi:MAG TPA: hypothetical protein VLV78_00330 [Thermoanaerobaculia bacterium]|nr:hypothetical protein [Thermoanaerobaculia bacterium]